MLGLAVPAARAQDNLQFFGIVSSPPSNSKRLIAILAAEASLKNPFYYL